MKRTIIWYISASELKNCKRHHKWSFTKVPNIEGQTNVRLLNARGNFKDLSHFIHRPDDGRVVESEIVCKV